MAHADDMVAKLEALSLANAGLKQITIDGTVISFDDLGRQLEYWRQVAARANSTRPRSAQIKLDQ